MLIGITGKMQNGKDTLANIIKEIYPYHDIIHFADPLKEICKNILKLTDDEMNTSEGKSKYNDFWEMTNREILQKIGTDAFRKGFREDFWVKLMSLKILDNENLIIPDVRFNDEAELIKKNGGIIIRINRDSVNNIRKELNHVSEKGIDENLVTFHIENDGTIDDLKIKSKRFFNNYYRKLVDISFEELTKNKKYKKEYDEIKEVIINNKHLNYYIDNLIHDCIHIVFDNGDKDWTKTVDTEFYWNNDKW